MNRVTLNSLAAVAAVALALTTIGSLVAVPPVQSQSPASFAAISELA